jgi:hypothetical protein
MEFRQIPGAKGYEVSRCGVIRRIGGDPLRIGPRGRSGYPGVCIRIKGVKRSLTVHRAVAMAWVPGRSRDKRFVAHKDGNPNNFHADNLRWSTQTENERDKRRHGTHLNGSRRNFAKLTDDEVRNIRELLPVRSLEDISKMFGITVRSVKDIAAGRKWATLEEMA